MKIASVVRVVVTLLRRAIEPACFLGTLRTGLQRNSQREWRKTRRRNLRRFRRLAGQTPDQAYFNQPMPEAVAA